MLGEVSEVKASDLSNPSPRVQAGVSLLDQVLEGEAEAPVALGDANHEPQVKPPLAFFSSMRNTHSPQMIISDAANSGLHQRTASGKEQDPR